MAERPKYKQQEFLKIIDHHPTNSQTKKLVQISAKKDFGSYP